MLQNNLSLSKILGIIIGSPALLGFGGIAYNLINEGISQDGEVLSMFLLMTVFVLMLLFAGIGLYLHKLWGRAIATSCIILIMIGLVIMLVAVAPNGNDDLPVLIGFVITGLVACSGILLFLYNVKVTQELLNNNSSIHDEILDSHLH